MHAMASAAEIDLPQSKSNHPILYRCLRTLQMNGNRDANPPIHVTRVDQSPLLILAVRT
jgi:hypothetical protein